MHRKFDNIKAFLPQIFYFLEENAFGTAAMKKNLFARTIFMFALFVAVSFNLS